jgi:hypothetical protein
MCTVTFIPVKSSVFITSNRDEKNVRSAAIYPELYDFSSGRILFPKDADAGGTWISIHENGNAIVFLNGGVVKHVPNPPYRKSRGLILLDLINSEHPFESFSQSDLQGIEPFTAIIWDNKRLFECRWDGSTKHQNNVNSTIPHIWSSVTLYSDEIIAKRKKWFDTWIKANPLPGQDDILHFHQFTGDGDSHNDLLMNRNGETFTVSITSIRFDKEFASMHYLDLKSNKTSVSNVVIQKLTGVLR